MCFCRFSTKSAKSKVSTYLLVESVFVLIHYKYCYIYIFYKTIYLNKFQCVLLGSSENVCALFQFHQVFFYNAQSSLYLSLQFFDISSWSWQRLSLLPQKKKSREVISGEHRSQNVSSFLPIHHSRNITSRKYDWKMI